MLTRKEWQKVARYNDQYGGRVSAHSLELPEIFRTPGKSEGDSPGPKVRVPPTELVRDTMKRARRIHPAKKK